MTPEKRFEMKVRKYLEGRGCWVLKTFSNGIQRAGVPDLLVCCKGRFLGIELKASDGRATELQKWNIRKIQEAGGVAMLLYPKDFEAFKQIIEEIEEEEGQ